MDPTYESYNSYDATSSADAAAASGVLAGLLLFYVIVLVVAYVLNSIFLSMVFKKAGIEPWKAWVPVYNVWLMLEMGEQPGWWSLLLLVPGVNIVAVVFLIIAQHKIGLKFGKSDAFVVLAILLPIVWLIWLAVDKSAVWQSAVGNGNNNDPSVGPQTPPSQPVAM